jgi:hypothetical protein
VINEIRERFIKSIAEKIAPERLVEAFFFPAIRQGPMETGVAVISASQAAVPVEQPDAEAVERAEVFTASYRWTRKGVERGKWVVDVTAEADAPFATVETVVRGVQERSGEALDAHRMSGEEIRAALPPEMLVAPQTEAAAQSEAAAETEAAVPVAAEAIEESAPTESAA